MSATTRSFFSFFLKYATLYPSSPLATFYGTIVFGLERFCNSKLKEKHRIIDFLFYPILSTKSFCFFAFPAAIFISLFGYFHRIVPVKTSRAKSTIGANRRCHQALQTKELQAVCPDDVSDFFGGIGRSNQLFCRRDVYTKVTWESIGRRTDAHMNFLCSGIFKHLYNSSCCGSPDNGIIHHHNALPRYFAFHRIKFD